MDAKVEFDHAAGWYAQTAIAPKQWPSLTFELDVDVCVIGGGLAGLTTALEVARRGLSVVLLEARRVAWSASGRNLGFVLPGFSQDIEKIIARVGIDHARQLWALSEEGVEQVRNYIAEADIPGIESGNGWLDVSKIDNGDELVRTVSLLGQEFGAEVEGWPIEKVRASLKSDHYFHAIHYPRAFHLHPLNYAMGLAAAAEAAGVRIFEETPALTIDIAGVRKRIETPQARVRANHIVLAGNVQLGRLASQLAETILPISTFAAVTEPLGDRLKDAITYEGCISDSHSANNHYRIVGGDRLLWSGDSTTWESNPRSHVGSLRRSILRIYPQLGNVEIANVWSGTMGFAMHRMPQIGEMTPGVWVASGFAGHGLNTTAVAGKLIARGIVEHDDTWRLFLPFDLVWAGGVAGRIVRQGMSAWRRRKESFAAKAARKREKLRIEAELAEVSDAKSVSPASAQLPAEGSAEAREN
jgi:glycine/D-amino acid oxidase-like deaminating enzyme